MIKTMLGILDEMRYNDKVFSVYWNMAVSIPGNEVAFLIVRSARKNSTMSCYYLFGFDADFPCLSLRFED